MELSNDRVFAELKNRIESENRPGRKRTFFSKSTKQEIEKILCSGFPPAALAKRLGVSDQTLARWRRSLQTTQPKPRRLKVVNDSSEPQAVSQVAAVREGTDVMLPNGIVLKNLAVFHNENLVKAAGKNEANTLAMRQRWSIRFLEYIHMELLSKIELKTLNCI